jgi:hypothetical protein
VQSVCDGFVKGRLLVDGSPGIERDLNKHAIFRPVDAKVVGSKDEAPRRMLGDDLEDPSGPSRSQSLRHRPLPRQSRGSRPTDLL